MPLCSKCHQNEATIHVVATFGATENENMHLCKDCFPATGLYNLDPQELGALSVIGKKCEFCRGGAFSGVMSSKSPIYWCYACGLEFTRILMELFTSERPDLMWRSKNESSFSANCCDS